MDDLSLYEIQLREIQDKIKICKDEKELTSLKELENDLKELINLSFLESLNQSSIKEDDEDQKVSKF
jgi:hypothetical protein